MKPLKIYDYIPDDILDTTGWYFKPDKGYEEYIIQLNAGKSEDNVVAVVSTITETDTKTPNGQKIITSNSFINEEILRLDIWPKYYFPFFTKQRHQWYHTNEYSNYIDAQAQLMSFAYELGIKEFKIPLL